MASSESAEEIHLKEMQIAQMEKSEILEFEQHLAAASSKKIINEQNSLLLPQVGIQLSFKNLGMCMIFYIILA